MADGLGTAPAKSDTKVVETMKPSLIDGEEILDWDFGIENPPAPLRSGRIEVTLQKVQTGPSPI